VHQIRFSEVTKLQTMNIAEHILSYLTQIDVPAAFTDAAKNLCFHYQTPKEKTLCHHDWHKGNLIRTELELILLDWEYAAIGDPLIDIACFINGLELKEPDIQKVSQRFHLNPDQLSQAITLTELMSFTWYLVRFADKDWSVQIQSWISRLKSL
jgi:thiamine kinase-like enzyme